MTRYAHQRKTTKSSTSVPSTDLLRQSQQFVCYALHAIPSRELLEQNVSYYAESNYSFAPAKRGLTYVHAKGVCVAYLMRSRIALLPLPTQLDANDAPYAIGYDFVVRSTMWMTPVASYYGFVIATMPMHDWQRSSAYALANIPAQALLHADRAILALAQIIAAKQGDNVYDEIARSYERFEKLVNLYLDQSHAPEGMLAYARALENAQRCYSALCALGGIAE